MSAEQDLVGRNSSGSLDEGCPLVMEDRVSLHHDSLQLSSYIPEEMWKIISRGLKADDLVTERFLGNQGDFLGMLREKEEQK